MKEEYIGGRAKAEAPTPAITLRAISRMPTDLLVEFSCCEAVAEHGTLGRFGRPLKPLRVFMTEAHIVIRPGSSGDVSWFPSARHVASLAHESRIIRLDPSPPI